MKKTPFDTIYSECSVPETLKPLLPRKWEMIGTDAILKLRDELYAYEEEIGEIYSKVLGAKSVYAVTGRIQGTYRKPSLKLIYGRGGETVHSENGVRFVLDAAKVMFSSANHDERMRMAGLDCAGETIVDMFAGIGHLSMPIAVHSSPRRILAAEADSDTFGFLLKTIRANSVEDVYEPVNADNRQIDERDADRVIMGYLENTEEWLPHAIAMCRSGATIHLHSAVPRRGSADWGRHLQERWGSHRGRKLIVRQVRRVKGYSALLDHMVADIEVM